MSTYLVIMCLKQYLVTYSWTNLSWRGIVFLLFKSANFNETSKDILNEKPLNIGGFYEINRNKI